MNAAGNIKYTWNRSDGASGPVEVMSFDKAGAKPVETTWTLGGAELPFFEGWQMIRILSPNGVDSAKANFTINHICATQLTFSSRVRLTQVAVILY